ncbi:MAG: hypothetical protein V4608_04465 [Bacteroidota bacterium]
MYKVSFSQKNNETNLVPNSGFETHKNNSGDISNAIPWVGVGTVDYFMKAEKRDTSRYKGARTGKCYAGLRFQREYKEYMYVKLTEPLEENNIYEFKMYVRLLNFNNVTVTIKQLGAYFSEEPFNEEMVFYPEGIVDSSNENGIAGTLNWIPIEGDYLAHGGEKYIVLGNFRTKMKDDFVKKNNAGMFEFEEGYYYVDDISVIKKDIPDSLKKARTEVLVFPDTLTAGQLFDIKNIHFEEGGSRILKISNKKLDEIMRMLNNHPFMEIQVHVTSNNQSIAKARAKAISDYLQAAGALNPITIKGIGHSNPNEKTECKVEIVITTP